MQAAQRIVVDCAFDVGVMLQTCVRVFDVNVNVDPCLKEVPRDELAVAVQDLLVALGGIDAGQLKCVNLAGLSAVMLGERATYLVAVAAVRRGTYCPCRCVRCRACRRLRVGPPTCALM